MAPRAYWRGSLKLSLVSCPIALYPASTAAEKTRFHMSARRAAKKAHRSAARQRKAG